MRNSVAALAVLCLLAACEGNPINTGLTVDPPEDDDPTTPIDPDPDPDPDGDTTADGVPLTVAVNLETIAFDPVADTLSVTIDSLDGTPVAVNYVRTPGPEADLPPGYRFYTLQEDPLDRFFAAVVAQSADGTATGAIVADGGQFNREFHGGFFDRTGGFDAPPVGPGPGQGQVSYAGSYVGLDDYSGIIPPLPQGADPALQMRGPGRVTGQVFINANFAEMTLNGAVFNRQLIDLGGAMLPNLVLVVTDIDEDGRFEGEVEQNRVVNGMGVIEPVGDYAGLFSGPNASSIAAALVIENFNPDLFDETETGLIVLNQCGRPGEDTALCTGAAP
ncbi:MAG: hypothetical protein AAF626_07180 [Pseudomonadota bacterium]